VRDLGRKKPALILLARPVVLPLGDLEGFRRPPGIRLEEPSLSHAVNVLDQRRFFLGSI
jgi:hypothetical protein